MRHGEGKIDQVYTREMAKAEVGERTIRPPNGSSGISKEVVFHTWGRPICDYLESSEYTRHGPTDTQFYPWNVVDALVRLSRDMKEKTAPDDRWTWKEHFGPPMAIVDESAIEGCRHLFRTKDREVENLVAADVSEKQAKMLRAIVNMLDRTLDDRGNLLMSSGQTAMQVMQLGTYLVSVADEPESVSSSARDPGAEAYEEKKKLKLFGGDTDG